MCDYSLHLVESRSASVADRLVTARFATSITRGFAAVGEPEIAVCLRPGTEIAFDWGRRVRGHHEAVVAQNGPAKDGAFPSG
jgi:hypothetical protein